MIREANYPDGPLDTCMYAATAVTSVCLCVTFCPLILLMFAQINEAAAAAEQDDSDDGMIF